MPETLKELPKANRPGRRPKHPYGDWFTAARKSPIKLINGKDFTDATPKTMQHNLYRAAKDQNGEWSVIIVGEDIALGKRAAVKSTTKSKG